MPEITEEATELLKDVRAAEGFPESSGVRLYSETHPDGGDGVGIALAEAPAEGDKVIEETPIALFIAPDVAEELGDVVLDVGGEPAAPSLVIRTK